MKIQKLREEIISRYMKDWLVKGGSWTLNEDGSVDVRGYIKISNFKEPKLPFKFGKVIGNFDCRRTLIESTENMPNKVTGLFLTPQKPGRFWG